jgi:hypothetical protein
VAGYLVPVDKFAMSSADSWRKPAFLLGLLFIMNISGGASYRIANPKAVHSSFWNKATSPNARDLFLSSKAKTRGPARLSLQCNRDVGGESESENGSFSKTPPPFDPSVLLPPMGLKPTKSRYEAFYAKSGPQEEAIDVDGQPDVQEGEQDEPPTNPFFVGYDMKELGFVWDVHLNTVGERPSDARKEEGEAGTGSLGGGLHDLILGICDEVDAEKKNQGEK